MGKISMYVIKLLGKIKILTINATKKHEQTGGDPVYYHSICTLNKPHNG